MALSHLSAESTCHTWARLFSPFQSTTIVHNPLENKRGARAFATLSGTKGSPMKSVQTWWGLVVILSLLTAVQGAGQAPPHASPRPLKVCLVSGSLEYESDASLAKLQQYLEKHYPIKCSRAFRKTDYDLPGLENLETCDVMLLFTRRLKITGQQLERVKRYCQAGKPIVALRTASHAFQNWLALDKEVLGGNYQNHYKAGPLAQINLVDQARNHPILQGVKPFQSTGSLYKNTGLAKDVTVLLTGTIPGHSEPLAWTRLHHGGRVFYTSLGAQKDFEEASFVRLLVNALYWATRQEPPQARTAPATGGGPE
jgi:type 1 glutamine amidotransferase